MIDAVVLFSICICFLQLLNPKLDMQPHNELLSALRLLVSEDRCEGRFVFGRHVPIPSKKVMNDSQPRQKNGDGAGGDNSKSQLQTLLLRAGHEAPTYKTKQLKNNQFRSTVIFNGLDFVGQPCGSKKLAEKDAAAEALLWLQGETRSSSQAIDHASILLKKSRKKNERTSFHSAKWS